MGADGGRDELRRRIAHVLEQVNPIVAKHRRRETASLRSARPRARFETICSGSAILTYVKRDSSLDFEPMEDWETWTEPPRSFEPFLPLACYMAVRSDWQTALVDVFRAMGLQPYPGGFRRALGLRGRSRRARIPRGSAVVSSSEEHDCRLADASRRSRRRTHRASVNQEVSQLIARAFVTWNWPPGRLFRTS